MCGCLGLTLRLRLAQQLRHLAEMRRFAARRLPKNHSAEQGWSF
ncbi:MAG: hypothetical protein AVDCRST_MAG42-447 [uncultured Chthoniobacterales bacterium]|uniref:Uncharacterized protein n=1 Tax=uncultured Chthoniobacterales bacterium TaxID=1836801 RepID=A0A6J4H9W4_9BACT|nr:MAG: hypothetical protein AVDCRST_MAG42-447 [uncultured Chthoniobacterales bacterium]